MSHNGFLFTHLSTSLSSLFHVTYFFVILCFISLYHLFLHLFFNLPFYFTSSTWLPFLSPPSSCYRTVEAGIAQASPVRNLYCYLPMLAVTSKRNNRKGLENDENNNNNLCRYLYETILFIEIEVEQKKMR